MTGYGSVDNYSTEHLKSCDGRRISGRRLSLSFRREATTGNTSAVSGLHLNDVL